MQDQLDLLRYAKILETEVALGEVFSGLPERLARHCRWKMLLNAGRWWLGGRLAGGAAAAAADTAAGGADAGVSLRWVPPGAGVVAADRQGAMEMARLFVRRDRTSVRIYRPDGRPAFTLLVPPG